MVSPAPELAAEPQLGHQPALPVAGVAGVYPHLDSDRNHDGGGRNRVRKAECLRFGRRNSGRGRVLPDRRHHLPGYVGIYPVPHFVAESRSGSAAGGGYGAAPRGLEQCAKVRHVHFGCGSVAVSAIPGATSIRKRAVRSLSRLTGVELGGVSEFVGSRLHSDLVVYAQDGSVSTPHEGAERKGDERKTRPESVQLGKFPEHVGL